MDDRPANRPLEGILWMAATGLCFVAVIGIVKHVGQNLPSAQAAFLRFLFGLVFFLPLLPEIRRTRLTPRHWAVFALRGTVHAVGVLLWFFAMTRITIAEVTAMNYMAPVYVTLGAALFLGERLAARRILAVAAAFLGAIIILRPGIREIGAGHLAMLVAPICLGGSYLLAKRLSGEFDASVIVALMSLTVTLATAPFALAVWVAPAWSDLAWMVVVAFFATAGHYAMTRSFAVAPVTVTQPVTFLQLVWAVLLGAVMFGEPLDLWVILGGLVILAAVSFIAWREHVLKRRAVTPAAHAANS